MRFLVPSLVALAAPLTSLSAQAIVAQASGLQVPARLIDFGSGMLPDGTPLTTQLAGLTFSHTSYFTAAAANNNVAGGFLANDVAAGPPNTSTIRFAQPVANVSFVYHQVGTQTPTTIRAKLQGSTVDSFTILWNETQPNNFFGFTKTALDEVQIDFAADFRLDELAFDPIGGAAWYPYNGSNVNPPGFGTVALPVLGATWQGTVFNAPNTLLTAVVFAPAGLATPPLPLFGGELLLNPSQPLLALVGTTTYSLPIPSASSWIGTSLALQAVRLDDVGGSAVFVPMNAMVLVIGL